jgi:glycosyltransferase involved in cell wall biosynthesis
MKFPRVLVICPTPINLYCGGGVTMASFFKGWPKDSIAQIYIFPIKPQDHSIVETELVIRSYGSSNKKILKEIKFIRKVISKASGYYFADFKAILSWCQTFLPQVIYAQPCDPLPFYWWLPYRLSQSLEIPLITHIMDDWPGLLEKKYISNIPKVCILKHELPRLLKSSQKNLGISDQMCKAFEKRYNVPFVKFHNSIEVEKWMEICQNYEDTKNVFNISYTGALVSRMQLQSVIDLAVVVSRLREKGHNIFFNIYASHLYDKVANSHLTGFPGVLYRGYIEHAKLPGCLASADVLFLPVNFDGKSLHFVRYSMPTKVPEYMASGTPVLVYGPLETPPVSYADSCKWGYVVSNRNLEELENAVLELMSSVKLRKELGQRARNLALQDFDADKIRQEFRQLICDVTFHGKNA